MRNEYICFPAAKQVVLQSGEVPVPKEGEVLIRTERTLISTGTELTFLNGEYLENSKWSTYIHYPMTSGYSNVGIVEQVGKGTDSAWVGKRVASFSKHSRYVVAHENALRPLRYDIPPELACFFAVAEVSLNGVRRTGISLGERAVVYGAGIIGQLVVRFLLAGGCTEIVVVDTADSRLAYLPKSRAITLVNPLKGNVLETVREITGGDMADSVYETTGSADLIPEEIAVLHQQGRMCLLSSPKKKTSFDFHDLCNAGSIQIIGAHTSSQPDIATFDNPWTCARNSETFFKMIDNGQMNMDGLISHRADCHSAPAIYEMLLKDRTQAMGVVLNWNEEEAQ